MANNVNPSCSTASNQITLQITLLTGLVLWLLNLLFPVLARLQLTQVSLPVLQS